LVEKGLIVHVPGDEPRRYIARSPEMFFEGVEDKLAKARRILPELKSLQKGTSEKPSVMYFNGVEGLKQAYEYREKDLHGKNIVGFFASAEDISLEVNQVFFNWNEYIERHKTHVRGLTVDSATLKPYVKWLLPKDSQVTMKYLPQEIYSANTSIESCNDQFVRICLMESVQMLIIESPKLAKALREVFEITWKELKGKYDEPKTLV